MIDNINNFFLNYFDSQTEQKIYNVYMSAIWKIATVLHIYITGKFPGKYVQFQLLKTINLVTF